MATTPAIAARAQALRPYGVVLNEDLRGFENLGGLRSLNICSFKGEKGSTG
jgi:hypothetical protein